MTPKEIHAFLNEDGTYHITGICPVRDGDLLMDATFDIPRAEIDIHSKADTKGRLVDFIIPEYEKYNNTMSALEKILEVAEYGEI